MSGLFLFSFESKFSAKYWRTHYTIKFNIKVTWLQIIKARKQYFLAYFAERLISAHCGILLLNDLQ